MAKHLLLRGFRNGAAPVALGLALFSTSALAQTTDPSQQQAQPSQGPKEGTPNPANADGQTPNETAAASGGDVVVTGSRIPQPNLTAASPVTVINSQEFRLTGTTRTEDLLNQLPQVFADQGGNVSNAATGTATVNLRNLGSQRTLVLVNGRRLGPGDPTDSAADLNFIPSTLVKRVDVLTGGASSAYGADAVGGVVNFIMDTDFTGFRVDSQYSLYQHDNNTDAAVQNALRARQFGYPDGHVADGAAVNATAVVGASFDDNRGHVVAYAGYRRINAVSQGNRDYSACALSANKAGALTCGGSPTSANGTVIAFAGGAATDPIPYGAGSSTYFQVGPNRTLIGNYTPYNYGPTNYFQRPDERYTAGFFGHYDVSDAFKPYLEGMFMDDRSVAQIAPSGIFSGGVYSLNCDNPLLSAQQRGIICSPGNLVTRSVNVVTGGLDIPVIGGSAPTTVSGAANPATAIGAPLALAPYNFIDPTTGATYNRGFAQILRRNVEGSPRQDDLQHTDFRIVVGARGDLGSAFTYDAYYQYGRTNYAETYRNEFSASRTRRALDVVTGPTGAVQCRSAVDGTDPNCVPLNIFTLGGVTQAALNYVTVPGLQRAQVTEQVAEASITGQLGKYGIKAPWANDGVGVNAGVQFRREQLNLDTDLEFQTGDLAGQGAPTLPVNGAFNVYEAFGEIRIPLVQQSFIYDLSIDGGYRHSHYDIASRGTDTDTYKIEGEFAPIRAIRFRGTYNRAVRSPNIQELFAPNIVGLSGSTDPCSGRMLTAADAGCLAQGLRAGQTIVANPAGQYNALLGGNPNLTPEIADTYTAGVVIQPDFVPFLRGLAITVDYFNINVKNTISTIGADTILAQCTSNAASPFCGLIHRDNTGSLWRSAQGYTENLQQNIGSIKTSGIDVGTSYAHELGGLGSLSMNFNGTYLNNFTTNNGVSDPYDCSGLYGTQCGTPAPKWRHKLRTSFTLPNGIGLSGAWRYFGPVTVDASTDNRTLNPLGDNGQPANNYSQFARRIGSQSYFDLAMTATIGEHYNFSLGVQNLLDRDPPLVSGAGAYACAAGFCNGNTYPQVYDALGRYIYAGITLNF